MRLRAGAMLQQNNNNNYPCLRLSASSQEVLQKCTRASLPLPNRLELSLTDLPVIRGLRAWALCSKNRRKAGGLLGGGQAPTALLAGRGSSKLCPRPADAYLSEEWGQVGYGLDTRQAGGGGLVTVATLKTSEGSGKTQTQCLFVRTQKGNCLYSKAKAGCGTLGTEAWLREKAGGGGARHSGAALPGQTRVNRVRAQSGRRWRRSGNAAGLSKEKQQREVHSGPNRVQEKQEEEDKGRCADTRHHNTEQDSKRTRKETDSSPDCCHDNPAKSCYLCGRRPQQQEDREPLRGGSDSEVEEQETTAGDNLEKDHSGGSDSLHPEPQTPVNTQISLRPDVEEDTTESEMEVRKRLASVLFIHSPESDSMRNDVTSTQNEACYDGKTEAENTKVGEGKGLFGDVESEEEDLRFQVEEEVLRDLPQVPVLSSCFEDVSPADLTASINSTASCPRTAEPSAPVGGSTCTTRPETEDLGVDGHLCCDNTGFETEDKSESIGHLTFSTFETGLTVVPSVPEDIHAIVPQTGVSEENVEEENTHCVLTENSRLPGSAGGFRGGLEEDRTHSAEVPHMVDTSGPVSTVSQTATITNILYADPSPPPSLHPVNPPPSPSLLRSVVTGLPCVEVERCRGTSREEQEAQTEKPWLQRELEEQGEASRGCTAAPEDTRKDEEFGLFVHAEGAPSQSERVAASASMPSGSRGDAGWTNGSFLQSEDTWTAFPQHLVGEGGHPSGQWWPNGAMEEKSVSQNLSAVFMEAFPSLPGPGLRQPMSQHFVPTLSRVLSISQQHSGDGQDQGRLLDTFHDLNKMIGCRYRRANHVSRDLLLKTLHLQKTCTEDTPSSFSANHRLSPHLPPTTQHTQLAAGKRRLSYDYNRNMVD